MKRLVNFTFAYLFLISLSIAQISLPQMFSDGMVLQQSSEVKIWGWDHSTQSIVVETTWGASARTTADSDGKWVLKLKTPSYDKKNHEVIITGSSEVIVKDVLLGEVWVASGQSNMEMPMKGYNSQPIYDSNEAILSSENDGIRMFKVGRSTSEELLSDVKGSWVSASPNTTQNFSATAYFFARKIASVLDVPIGIIQSSWGGTPVEAWTDIETLRKPPLDSFAWYTSPEREESRKPAALFNGMINPLIGYTIRGAIWYQGERNRNEPEEYGALFEAMIKSWRDKWQLGDFPFYFVQIAPFGYKDVNSAYLREAQFQTMDNIAKTGMVSTMDIGDEQLIHPGEKKTVGNRLAYWALAKDYGVRGIGFDAPRYESMELKENQVIIKMKSPNGLSAFGKPLSGFEVAGEDRVFYPAQAAILGRTNKITVSSEKVPQPIAVRYAFKSYVVPSLFSIEGIPVSLFRTDNWKR